MDAGVIVAGGRSNRFGDEDKALADLAGVPMVRRVARRLSEVVDELVVNCRADQRTGIERALSGLAFDGTLVFAADATPDRGPLAGVETGLATTNAEYAAVVAADMPLVAPRFVSALFERARGHDAAVPRYDGRLQPLQAVYRTDAMVAACATALSCDERRLTTVLSDLDHVVVVDAFPAGDLGRSLTNLNTREAFERLARELTPTGAHDATE